VLQVLQVQTLCGEQQAWPALLKFKHDARAVLAGKSACRSIAADQYKAVKKQSTGMYTIWPCCCTISNQNKQHSTLSTWQKQPAHVQLAPAARPVQCLTCLAHESYKLAGPPRTATHDVCACGATNTQHAATLPVYMPPDDTVMTREGAPASSAGIRRCVSAAVPSALVAKLCS
jgi:hypothetical protein